MLTFRSKQPLKRLTKQRPSISRRQGEAFEDDEKLTEEILGLSRQQESTGENKLAAQVNAVAVLDMIKSLQEEIKVYVARTCYSI